MQNYFTLEKIQEAYTKLKTYVYYDSGELLLREKIVEFETNIGGHAPARINFSRNIYRKYADKDHSKKDSVGQKFSVDEKLEIFTDQINKYDLDGDFFDELINKISIDILPKKFETSEKKGSIITNKRIKEEYALDKVTAFINAPVEIHIISVLWLIEKGIKIDSKLLDECMGNRLFLNMNKNNLVQGTSLFKPYFKQYQKWRDGAVNSAKSLLDNDKNALFLNLDIKDYFYSVRIPSTTFSIVNKRSSEGSRNNLDKIMNKVHENYTSILLKRYSIPFDFKKEIVDENGMIIKFILPIGLLSSYTLANDYLKDFDKIILEKYKPAYYGRYVDDILIVLSQPKIEDENNRYSKSFFSFEEYRNKINFEKTRNLNVTFSESDMTEIEKYILHNFSNIISLVDNPFYNESESDCCYESSKKRIFKLNGYQSLYFQSEKTILHFFDKDESSIVIDKLKKELEEKSSEFRDMPNDTDDENIFEESAYFLNYDGSEGKIKTLKDYKENKFGLAVYLSHKINLALRNEKVISEEEQKKIINFFKGENCLSLFKLWEKILTLFVVNYLPKNYIDFLFHCLGEINKIDENKKYNKTIISNVKESLVKHLLCSHEISISLNLNFLKDSKIKRNYDFKSNEFTSHDVVSLFSDYGFLNPMSNKALRYRISNMIRHHYVVIPLLNYVKTTSENQVNLINRKTHINLFELNFDLLHRSPRPIKFWECCIASAFEELNDFSKDKSVTIDNDGYLKTDILYDLMTHVQNDANENEENEYSQSSQDRCYLDRAFDIYIAGNKNHLNQYDLEENIKKEFFVKVEDSFEINKNKKLNNPKIAFANTKIFEENILNSILDKPNLSVDRYNKLAKILKKAREEKADIVLFPECFIPINLLSTVTRYACDNESLLISGLEHVTINNTSFNFVVTVLPVEVNGIKDATVILRLKNNYSPGEENLINKNHLIVPKPKKELVQIINWRNLYFSVCYCFEMANITHREKLKGKIDLLVGIEWNKDIPYFSNIVEASSRDLHCYVAQVNTSNYGDTRLSQPTESALKDILKLKGGINDLIIVGEINTKKLRDFQRVKTSINNNKDFKPLPPNFDLENILKRINNF